MADSSRYRTIMTGLVTLISLYHSTYVYVANCISISLFPDVCKGLQMERN
ncbi:hypothetical protein HanXRQr2_Chr15g0715921 [Helianthus annuus]|uniref:Uncharacterized protein n=1 Tax=Helianthus annuus TaxID=4232 RepID=A0A9K3E4Y7_HELAN|nr:hypothetical protein HanXRQr2_Chr15g0715921 [Helianthus annuus]KAJ0833154.1 hypothetical protein HanPSC8_Chr15g0687001 [Helianthus annuus]